jgi:hypothetical protein
MSATNAVRVHVALLKVLGEPVVKLLVLGKDKAKPPQDLPRQHAEPGTEAPPLPGVTPSPADGDAADDISVMGVKLSGDDVLTIGGAIGLMADRMREDEFIALLGACPGVGAVRGPARSTTSTRFSATVAAWTCTASSGRR